MTSDAAFLRQWTTRIPRGLFRRTDLALKSPVNGNGQAVASELPWLGQLLLRTCAVLKMDVLFLDAARDSFWYFDDDVTFNVWGKAVARISKCRWHPWHKIDPGERKCLVFPLLCRKSLVKLTTASTKYCIGNYYRDSFGNAACYCCADRHLPVPFTD